MSNTKEKKVMVLAACWNKDRTTGTRSGQGYWSPPIAELSLQGAVVRTMKIKTALEA